MKQSISKILDYSSPTPKLIDGPRRIPFGGASNVPVLGRMHSGAVLAIRFKFL